MADGGCDLAIGDEAWDVDCFLHENPGRKRFGYAWFTDFVGWLPMPEGGEREAALTRLQRRDDRAPGAIPQCAGPLDLRGQPGDVVTDPFGPGLPRIRDWTIANFDFAGYVTASRR